MIGRMSAMGIDVHPCVVFQVTPDGLWLIHDGIPESNIYGLACAALTEVWLDSTG